MIPPEPATQPHSPPRADPGPGGVGTAHESASRRAIDDVQRELLLCRQELDAHKEMLRELRAELDAAGIRYRDLYEQAPVGYVSISQNGRIAALNRACERVLGCAREEVLQRAFSSLLAPEARPQWQDLLARTLSRDEHQNDEFLLRQRRDGAPVHVRLDCVRGVHNGEQVAVCLAVTDISQRKQAEQALLLSENFARAIANHIPGMLGYWTRELRCTFANEGYLAWFGRTIEQMQGIRMQELLGAELFAKNEPYIRAVLRGKDQQFERTLIKANGELSYTWAQYIAHKVEGEVLGFFVLVTDITAVKLHQEQLRLSDAALKAVSQGVVITSHDQRILTANEAFLEITGYARDEVIGRNCRFLQGPLTDPRSIDAIRAALDRGEEFSGEILNYRQDGSVFWNDLSISPVLDEQGRLNHFIGITRDVTGRKCAENELRIASVAFASQSGMIITDPQGIILRVNPAFSRLTGYAPEEAIGQTPAMLNSGRQDRQFYERMWQLLHEKGYWQGEIWNRRKNGQIYAELLTVTAVVTPDGTITHFVGNFSDITEDREAAAEIHRLAYYDALTHLPNRRLLQDRLAQAVAATVRSGHYGAIFFIDLDNFKALNDTRGHDVGDLLLIEVAQRLRRVVRESDTVARQGGDEFVVLLEDLGEELAGATHQAKVLGEKLREVIDTPFLLKNEEYHCGGSIGVALFHERDTAENLFKHADLALYHAKNSGRNTLRFFDPAMQAALDRRATLESELRQALKGRQFRLHYQPQVDIERRLIGVEALLRWQHPQRGMVSPNDFIPLAEETGLILPIGLWVLETACELLKHWQGNARTRGVQVAVNVSARQFRQLDFAAQVQRVLETSGANPALLKLELTESLVLEDVENTIAKMHAIKALGVQFSMDDFGTGYSSLSYLARLPLDQLKIDQSFVRNLPGRKNDETITRTIITMGQGLAMEVIAEGVETEAQCVFLEELGCRVYQGYLFSRPLPAEALDAFIAGS
ncbi:sensor domain-containing protein [Rhodocyclus gracilis]|uniref:EAL domain-containing protein n=1 Tax=Rhodocyclus tenuis TaxID=1066 RepID=A0A6L5JSX5_RHOTE|nr:EAL domain-containing protein [Rhodocyclus gracilis]MQY50246.1 EAL domain-containing protein [Rhodocyclus gracilis]